MLRVVLAVGSVLILGALMMQHAVTLPRGMTLTLPDHVDQGIPLAAIDLRSTDQSLTTDEIAQGMRWWQHQSQALLDQLTTLLRNETRADGWTNLYASATADGGHVLVAVGNQGRLGTIRFAGDGTLLSCDTTSDDVLPIILPSSEGGFRRPSTEAVGGITARLRYLRERSPVAWIEEGPEVVTVESLEDDLPMENEANPWYPWRVCFFTTAAPHARISLEQEPPLPQANN